MSTKETHPFQPYIPENATKLIIGTTPPPRFAKNELSDNLFWDIIGEIAFVDFKKENSAQEVEKRKNFLENNNIGICDIVLKTNRKKPNSATDDDLIDIEHLDIVNEILAKHPKIDTLLYTSVFVKKQMTQLLKKLFGKEICHKSTNDDKVKEIIINNKKYKAVILYSPSPSANRGIGKNAGEKKREQYKKIFEI